ncbi:MAG: PQQ-binding-like beta-propeller repeat protein [Anaerolineales bacterium]|nr:PQQ-binding-like beta-propeller repeat protein [Anaerolineales bacterium]
MPYYDISGKLEFISSSSQNEIKNKLVSSLNARQVIVLERGDNEIAFNIPVLKTLTRGNTFQGITSGNIRVKRGNENQFVIEYGLVTFLMRVFFFLMILWVTVGLPLVSKFFVENFDFREYIWLSGIFFIIFTCAILLSQQIVKYKFSSFLKAALTGLYSEVKKNSWVSRISIKRVAIVSCSGIFLAILLIPTYVLFVIWGTRAKVAWEYPIKSAIISPPLITESAIYFGSLGDVEQAAFYSLAKETGKEIWVKQLSDGLSSSPIIVGNMVCFGADDGYFRCLDLEMGNTLWKFSPEQRSLDANDCDQCALKINDPFFDGTAIYFGSHDHNLYALDPQNGQLLWSFFANGSVFESPTVLNGIVYIGSEDGNIYAIDSESGKEFRRYPIPSKNASGEESGVYSTPIVDAGTIYAVNGTLAAVDMETGDIKWQILGSSLYTNQIIGNPILFKDVIIVPTLETIYAVDKISGEIRWKQSDIKDGIFFTPTLYQEMIYFGDSNGYLYGISANTGKLSFRYNMNYLDFSSYVNFFQDFTFPPSTDGKLIYVKWLNHLYGIQHKK